MFKKRKYTLKFKKTFHDEDFFHYKEVDDLYLMKVLAELWKEYNISGLIPFEIISVNLKSFSNDSSITIKCNKKDKNMIFLMYCSKLKGLIEDIRF